MNTKIKCFNALAVVAAVGILSVMAPAQNINKRLQNQNQRINQGVKNGELTRNQVDALKSRDASIRARELRDKAHDNGKLTTKERQNLNKSLNATSKAIYRDKHDAAAHGG